MKIFGKLESYLYTALASVVMIWASHHPAFHDAALWLLGVIGHAIGSSGKSGDDAGAGAPVTGAVSGSAPA